MHSFARIEHAGRAVWAVSQAHQLSVLEELGEAHRIDDIIDVIHGKRSMGRLHAVDAGKVHWLSPVPTPGKVVCLGLNYAAHAAEGGNAAPEYPAFFMRGASSLIAHDAPLIRPRVSDKLDYEAELAVVIAQRARHLTADQALKAALANQQAQTTTGQANLQAALSTQQLGTQTGLQAALANQQQALDRAGGKHGNKGAEAAATLLELLLN